MNGERQNCCTKDRLCGLSMFLSVCLLFALVCVAILSYLVFVHSKKTELCTSIECIQSAAEINEFVEDEVDACEDFHEFTCGKFMKTASEKRLNNIVFAEEEKVESKINKFITEPETKDDLQPVIMQKRYFQACQNEEDMDRNNNTDFLSLLNEIGGWPILHQEEPKENNFDWMRATIRARQLGLPFNWFLDVKVTDIQGTNYLTISKPADCASFRDDSNEKYVGLIGRIVGDLNKPNIEYIGKIYDVVDFEKKLAQICVQLKKERAIKTPITALEPIWSRNMEAKKFINDLTGQFKNWQPGSQVAYEREYIYRLIRLLGNTTKEIQANYVGWKITQYFAPYLSKYIREKYLKYIEKEEDRFQFCLADTKSRFHLVSEAMYIRESISPEITEAATELVNSIKDALTDKIRNSAWMNNGTKENHLNFYDKMNIIIGGPQVVFDDYFFIKYRDIGQLSFSSFNIIRMLSDLSRNAFNAKMTHIGRPSMEPLNIEYFQSTELTLDDGTLYLPPHLFHGTTYRLERPQYLNYGSLGTLTAEKMIETIIPAKKDNDYHSYMRNLQCSMSKLQRSSHGHNTTFMAERHFVIIMSRQLAYNAYQKYVEENGEELQLPGITYSPNQLFWIKSAMNYCYKNLPNAVESSLEEKYKNYVLESVKNSQWFGEDFSCEEDTPMNPSDKCSIF